MRNSLYIKVKVKASSKNNSILEKEKDYFLVTTKAKPENGEANISVLKIIASKLNKDFNDLKIVKGLRSSLKIVKINHYD